MLILQYGSYTLKINMFKIILKGFQASIPSEVIAQGNLNLRKNILYYAFFLNVKISNVTHTF